VKDTVNQAQFSGGNISWHDKLSNQLDLGGKSSDCGGTRDGSAWSNPATPTGT